MAALAATVLVACGPSQADLEEAVEICVRYTLQAAAREAGDSAGVDVPTDDDVRADCEAAASADGEAFLAEWGG